MRRSIGVLLAVLLLGIVVVPAVAAPAKAVCPVCRVKHGESEAEPVRATRTYAGVEYGFCSDDCAEAFDADPAAYVPAALPRPAPAFALRALDGATLSPAALAGRVVLLDFWATWCVPCRKSMPALQALHDRYAGRGFIVVGVSIDENGAAKVKKFVAAKKLTYPIALDDAKAPAWDAFRVKAVPASYLIGRDGTIVAEWLGAPPDGADLRAKIEAALQPATD